MSRLRPPPPPIDENVPEYYTELLTYCDRSEPRRLPLNERQTCRDIAGVQGVDAELSRRLQTLLDAIADISLYEPKKNVSATMASLTDNRGTLETQLYIVFNRKLGDEIGCRTHLETIFNKLQQVPYEPPGPATDGSPKVIGRSLKPLLLDLCEVIHEYSFEVFAHRVNKRKDSLAEIRGYFEQDQTNHFKDEERPSLAAFFRHVDMIITNVAEAQDTGRSPGSSIRMLLLIYSYWTEHNLLPDLHVAGDRLTLLDKLDEWLGKGFLVKRWAQKIMSFVISASRLFALTQSTRLRNVILGNLSIKILTSPPAAPYTCNLSSEAIRALLDRLITDERAEDYEETRESFIDQLKKKKAPDQVCQYKPTVHAELAMVMAMVNEDITHVLPYIGVSKLSCIMCSHYIRAFNQVMGQKIAVRDSHGKAYPGWSWPVSPGRNEELRVAFLKRIREQLRNDFEDYAERHRRRSDSTVGSSGPSVKLGATDDEISEAFASDGGWS